MYRRHAIVLLAAVSGLLAVPASGSDPVWQPPREVSPETPFISSQSIAFDGAGNTIAWWSGNRKLVGGEFGKAISRVAVRPRGSDRWRTERSLPALSTFAPFGDERARVVDTDADCARCAGNATVIRAHTRTLAGRRIGSQVLQVAPRLDSVPGLSTNARGDAVVAWTAQARGGSRVFAALARRDRPFGRPVAVSPPGEGGATIAIGPRGDALVAWASRSGAVYAVRAYAGRGFGSPQRVGRAENHNAVSAAVGAEGAAAIAWTAQPYESGDGAGPIGPAQLRIAYARPHERFEIRARPARGMGVGSPYIAFDSIRHAVFVWTEGNAIRTGEVHDYGASSVADIVPAGAERVSIEALAAGPRRGRALVLWTAG